MTDQIDDVFDDGDSALLSTKKSSFPELNRKKPFIQIRDRARPNVSFQQTDNLFDRQGRFVDKALYALEIKEAPPPVVKTRDISERKIGRVNKSVVDRVIETANGLVTASAEKKARAAAARAARKTLSLPDAVTRAAKENARAAAAEANA